jgi:hypothetical protein
MQAPLSKEQNESKAPQARQAVKRSGPAMLLVSYPGNQSEAIRRARSADYETVINDLAFCRAREGSFPALCEFPVAGQGSSEQPGACHPRVVGSRPCSRPDWFGVALRSTQVLALPVDASRWSEQPDWINNEDNYLWAELG